MPVINKPIQYFSVATWNGSGSATATIEFGMQPDLVVIKPRNNVAANANAWVVVDSTRGTSARLSFNNTAPEWTESNNVISFNSTGITVGDSHNVNKNTTSQYVGFGWKKGATQGFDIVTYTGTGANTTVSHNLGVAPSMMIVKRRDSGPSSWTVWHSSFSSTEYIYLNLTNAKSSSSGATVWNSTLPTNSVFSLGTYTDVNASAGTYVAYLFSEVAGFSRIGSYTGNGSADGPFVHCGFLPRFVMIKQSSASGQSWQIQDATREPYNDGNRTVLFADTSGAEITDAFPLDFLSNGFKIRNTGNGNNASGATYIFMAFAENPFKYSLAR
jgi:hypothetical protein